jgi:sulfoxide reductase heme-binding subunit YedZ
MIGATVVGSKALWYLTRGTGAVSLLLLTVSVVLGIAHSVRWAPRRMPRFVVADLHRNVSLLVVVFIVIHVATSVIDSFAPIRWLDAIIPFGSRYRPVWLGLGALAFDVLIAVAVTSLVRARMGYRVWRAIHWTAYGSWAVAVFHGVGVGSDTKQVWMLALVATSVVAVAGAIGWRVAVGWSAWTPPRLAMAMSVVLMPLALVAWMASGPLRAGWARAAGTPTAILTGGTVPAAGGTGTAVALVLPSQARFDGSAQLGNPDSAGQVTLTITGQTSGSPRLSLLIQLQGTMSNEGGLSVRTGTVTLTPPDGAAAYQGPLATLSSGGLSANLSDGQGDQIGLTIQMQIAPSGTVAGAMAISPGSVGSGGSSNGGNFGSGEGGGGE